jgi:RNA polymerase sigma-70 factor (ECF subfamily)
MVKFFDAEAARPRAVGPSEAGLAAFPTTNWADVAAAASKNVDRRLEALERLLPRYWPALKGRLANRFGLTPEAVEDALQGFVLDKVLVGELLAKADRSRGRFRCFLLEALDNHVSNQLRHERALKRRPESEPIPLEGLNGEEPAFAQTLAAAEDVAWARAVMSVATERMELECRGGGRADIWGVFQGRALGPTLAGQEPVSYEALTEQLNLPSVQAGRLLLNTGKLMFRRVVRGVIAEYARHEQQVEDEMEDLKAILMGE